MGKSRKTGPRLSSLRRLQVLRLLLVVFFSAGMLAAVWAGHRVYSGYAATFLQEELNALGRVTAAALEGGGGERRYRTVLKEAVEAARLENAFLADPSGRSVADARPGVRKGTLYSPVLLDREALRDALSQGAAFGPEQSVGGFAFRSVYLSAKLPEGAAVLVLSAGEEFSGVLSGMRSAALRLTAAAAVMVALYIALFAVGEALARRLEREERRKDALALTGMLAAEMAHRIRNPLAVIQSAVETLRRRRPDLDDPLLDYIPEEVARIDRSVERLLSTGKPAPADPVPVSLSRVVENAVRASGLDKRFPGISVETSMPADSGPCIVPGDAEALEEAVSNILVNAAEALSGSGRITVALSPSRDGGRFILSIKDDGPGIPPEALSRIFDPFFSMKPSGTGLGLAIARNTIEQHGASLEVRSGPEGTEFIISFPAAESQAHQGDAP